MAGKYEFSYYPDGRLEKGILQNGRPFGKFLALNYALTYKGDETKVEETDCDGAKYASVGYGPGVYGGLLSINFNGADRSRVGTYIDPEMASQYVTEGGSSGRKYTVENKAKYKDGNLVSINVDLEGSGFLSGKGKVKVEYTDIPYVASGHGFNYMSFILSQFLDVKYGYFDSWPVDGYSFYNKYPKSVEISAGPLKTKYLLSYTMNSAKTMKVAVERYERGKLVDTCHFTVSFQ